jgi:hypothetical protein
MVVTLDAFWNYEGHPATILLAVVDSDLCSTDINCGAPGNMGDAGFFSRSTLKQ